MHIIKLNAIPSTNTFLKELSVTNKLDDFTTVVAENQTNGKGQRGNFWFVETGKNLTFSTLIKDFLVSQFSPFLLNVFVSISIIQALEKYNLSNLKIKWPNDILAGNKKIGGILIENTFKKIDEIESVIGIGININQSNFDNLPRASSILLETGQLRDKEELLEKIVLQIEANYKALQSGEKQEVYFWNFYHQYLFRKDIPSVFEDLKGNKFQGIIKKVTKEGRLHVKLENDCETTFDIKQLSLLY